MGKYADEMFKLQFEFKTFGKLNLSNTLNYIP